MQVLMMKNPSRRGHFFFGVFCGLMVGLAAGMYIGLLWYIWWFSDASAPTPQAIQPIIPKASAQQQTGWLTYEDPLFGMKVSYPENWTREDGSNGVTLTAPDGDSDFIFTLGIDYSPGTGTAKSELRDFVEILRGGMSRIPGGDFRVIEANSTTLGGLPAESATYAFYDSKTNKDHTTTQIVAVIGDDIYRVHYSTTSPQWERLLPTFERMVESVELTN